MGLHFAICDDEPAQTALLKQMVLRWAGENGRRVEADCFSSAEAFLFRYEEAPSYDFLLLDIEMGEMNGVELASGIRSRNREIQIIFITGYMEYLAAGYDVEALHYLLKPVTEEKLFSVLDRGCEKLKQREKALLLENGEEMIRLPLYEIRWAEVRRNYITIHAGEDITVKKTLSQLEAELDDSFFRAGRSYLVNLRYVRKITKTDLYLKDGTAVPLSRGLYEAANRAFIRNF